MRSNRWLFHWNSMMCETRNFTKVAVRPHSIGKRSCLCWVSVSNNCFALHMRGCLFNGPNGPNVYFSVFVFGLWLCVTHIQCGAQFFVVVVSSLLLLLCRLLCCHYFLWHRKGVAQIQNNCTSIDFRWSCFNSWIE